MRQSNGYTAYDELFHGWVYHSDEVQFMLTMLAYQKRYRRRYPTWREILHVLHCLGYRKVAEPVPVDAPKPPFEEHDPGERPV